MKLLSCVFLKLIFAWLLIFALLLTSAPVIAESLVVNQGHQEYRVSLQKEPETGRFFIWLTLPRFKAPASWLASDVQLVVYDVENH